MLVVSDRPATGAAVYTQNKVKGAPLRVTAAHLADGTARAILCNSGIANTCAADGMEKARAMCELAAGTLGIAATDVVVPQCRSWWLNYRLRAAMTPPRRS